MPSELRQVVFQMSELQAAIRANTRNTKEKLPPGDIVAWRIIGTPEAFIEFNLRDEITGQDNTATYSEASVGAALLKYCMDHRIPVPRRAEKALKIVNGDVALVIVIKPPGA